MKEQIKKFFPVLIAALGVCFAALVYFIGFLGTERGIYTDMGTALTETTEAEIISDVSSDNSSSISEVPAIKYSGGARTVGDAVRIKELFQFTYSNGTTVSGADEEAIVIYLLDIEDTSENSVLEKYTTEEIEAMEEITSPFIFDAEKKILHFHKSGSFKVHIKVYYDANTSIEYEFFIPVEVR